MSRERFAAYLEENRHNYGWLDGNLPITPQHHPTVTMTKEQVIRFRNDYRALLEFVSYVLEKPIEEICTFDLIAHLFPPIPAEDTD